MDRIFCYIAMELALGTVEDYIRCWCKEKPDTSNYIMSQEIDDINVLQELSRGLVFLHSKGISEYKYPVYSYLFFVTWLSF